MDAERPKGPRQTCPACGHGLNHVNAPVTYCTPKNRMWIFWPFKRCEIDGKHLHQRCDVCGCAWMCRPTDISDRA